MSFNLVKNVSIKGLACCIPKNVEENSMLPFYKNGESDSVVTATGIERRHVVNRGQTASDLCLSATEIIIEKLGWEKDSIDLLAFCTQTPDYLNHPNSFVVHDRLGLPENTMCLDFYHGCPGWVTSLCCVSSMISHGHIKRALLLDGDTASLDQDCNNREEKPLFGDAGTVTAIEFDYNALPFYFNIGTKSDDGKALIHVNGGYRHPFTIDSLTKELDRIGGRLKPEDIESKMDSMDVFSFAITKVPKAIKKLCIEYDLNLDSIDNLVLHQANKLIVENIAKRIKVPMGKVPMSLKNYGNTTSASIPLTLVCERADLLKSSHQKNLVCGFGTGLSWGAAYFETDKIVCPKIIEI